jgi:hypothetical protein
MRKNSYDYAILAITSVLLVSCAGYTKYMTETDERLQPDKGHAVVVFMRPYMFVGGGRNLAVMDGDAAIGNLPIETQFEYLASPGKHVFFAGAAGMPIGSVNADLAPGKTYYVIVSISSMKAVKKGTPLMDTAMKYEKDLKRIKPDRQLLKEWSDANKAELERRASHARTLVMESDKESILLPEDGR